MFSHFKVFFAIFTVLVGNLIVKASSEVQSTCKDSLNLRYLLLEDPEKALTTYCSSYSNQSLKSNSLCQLELSTNSSSSSDICSDLSTIAITSARYWKINSHCSIKNITFFKLQMKLLR